MSTTSEQELDAIDAQEPAQSEKLTPGVAAALDLCEHRSREAIREPLRELVASLS